MKTVELKDLIGEHLLTGCDESTKQIQEYGELQDCGVINFTLDGKTYSACEDPNDGYRSSMREIIESETPTTNTFPPVKVSAQLAVPASDGSNILELTCLATGKIVLRVGTDNSDDYYPSWVASFTPENFV